MSIIRQLKTRSKRQSIRKLKKLCRGRGCTGYRYAKFVRFVQRHRKYLRHLGRKSFVKTDRKHDLCGKCNRAEMNRLLQSQLSQDQGGNDA